MNATSEAAVEEVGKSWRSGPNVFIFGLLALLVVAVSEYSQHIDRQFVNGVIERQIEGLATELAAERNANREFRQRVSQALAQNEDNRKNVADSFYDLQANRHTVTTSRLERMEAALNRIEGAIGTNGTQFDPQ